MSLTTQSATEGAQARGRAVPPGSQAAAETYCSHCGLPVPTAQQSSSGQLQFCCTGCRAVWNFLRSAGLEQYYTFLDQLGERGKPVISPDVSSQNQNASEFDSAQFEELYCDDLGEGACSTELLIEGAHCAACVWLVERLPRLESSVREARLDLSRSSVTLVWDKHKAPLSQIARTLTQMGYKPRPYRGREAERMRRDELRSLLIRIGVAGAVAGNVMLMAFALYSGDAALKEAGAMDATTVRFFEVLSLLISLPALWAGSVFFRGAWSALRTRTPHMDLPIAIGIVVAFAWGASAALLGKGEIYLDSITTLIFFLLIGRYLQRRHQLAAADAAELLFAVVPGTARIVTGEGEGATQQEIMTGDIYVGAHVAVRSGEVVPVDGTVVRGSSALDKSLLSGESRPVSVSVGDDVEAGALNLGSEIVVVAAKAGAETRVARLMREVEKTLSTRARLVGQVDRIAGIFTVSVLFLALAVGVYGAFDSPSVGIQRALALLIVACPCALGMATPLALSAGVSQAARNKTIVFSADAIEQLAHPTELVIDKTGTLTHGDLKVTAWVGDATLTALVAELEQHSAHPVARALQAYGAHLSADSPRYRILGPVHEQVGGGLWADTAGGALCVGSSRFVSSRAEVPPLFQKLLALGHGPDAPVLVALSGSVCAVAWVGDVVRDDAAESLLALYRKGHRLHLLSGDHTSTVRTVAAQIARQANIPDLFVSVAGEVAPEEKLGVVRGLKGQGRAVVMVGDGVNDSAALAAADVGIAVKGAAEASRLCSDVYLANPGVRQLQHLFEGSERTLRTIRRGIVLSLGYNAIGISCAALGIIGPLEAAVLMPISSLTVVTHAYKSRMFGEKKK
jgi:P-type Cu2+ transporter